ncbi:TetR/AcrR family transcriptional regulator, partial [Nocardia brasiliensis]|uniref:TetR/AcrR family transcriptional regulator n=1 Tax=Nocardia brasiliensis TaxID=37326 RepID=UPI002456E6B0
MTEPGRRERKKAANRQALADAALRLFLERGYDAVGVREIADAADVSVATLFKHFPGGKEALVVGQGGGRGAGGGGGGGGGGAGGGGGGRGGRGGEGGEVPEQGKRESKEKKHTA